MRKGKVTQKTIYNKNIDLLAAIGTKIGQQLPVVRYFKLLEKLGKKSVKFASATSQFNIECFAAGEKEQV